MGKKNIKKYLKSLNVDDQTMANLAKLIIYGDTVTKNFNYNNFSAEFKKHEVNKFNNYQIDSDFTISDDVVGLMSDVNRMVKDEKCPNNLRNRFYGKKLKVIEELIKEGRCSEFYKEGHCYSLLVDGKYRFHQLKNSHPHWEDDKYFFNGEREYTKTEPLPFDAEKYRSFMMSATLYLGRRKKVA